MNVLENVLLFLNIPGTLCEANVSNIISTYLPSVKKASLFNTKRNHVASFLPAVCKLKPGSNFVWGFELMNR